jgi:hypothetical protein
VTVVKKWKRGKGLTPTEKREWFWAALYALNHINDIHSDLIEDWMEDQALTQKDKEALRDVTGERTLTGAIESFFDGSDLKLCPDTFAWDVLMKKRPIETRDDLLRAVGITPRSILDLMAVVDFNLNDPEDHIDEEAFLSAQSYYTDRKVKDAIAGATAYCDEG